VVKNYETRHNATVGDRTYVRGLSGSLGQEYAIVRLGNIYYKSDEVKKRALDKGYHIEVPERLEYPSGFWRPVNTWGDNNEIIGYELYEVSRATLAKNGDPAILTIESGRREVHEGDFILPLDEHSYPTSFKPRAMSGMPDNLKVLAVEGAGYGVGHFQIVAISAGSLQGVEAGHVFSAFRPGEFIRDRVKYPAGSKADISTWDGDKVQLPDEYDAHIMVFRVFDEVSYAMVMDGARPVREHDILRHPDQKL
jgi:hypothetical protein